MPPEGFPIWLWTILGVVLPIVYQSFIAKMPGFYKFVITWGFSALIVVIVGLLFLHYSPAQLLGAFAWVIAATQAVYHLLVKPAAKRIAVKP